MNHYYIVITKIDLKLILAEQPLSKQALKTTSFTVSLVPSSMSYRDQSLAITSIEKNVPTVTAIDYCKNKLLDNDETSDKVRCACKYYKYHLC